MTILGGGPAGLAVALYAHRRGIPFVLLEKSEKTGGLCRTLTHGRHRYDTGAHRFHDRFPEVTSDLRALMGDELQIVKAPSQVYIDERFFDFPPTPLNVLASAGLIKSGKSVVELIKARLRPRPVRSFADFALNAFGPTLARRFLLNYSEKVWGLSAHSLSPDIATRRLKGMNFGSLLRELLLPKQKFTHIDGHFLYPRSGYGAICRTLSEQLPADSLRTGSGVERLDCEAGSVRRIRLAGRRPVAVPDQVVSTLPLPLLITLMGDALPQAVRKVSRQLGFRSVRLVFLRLNQERVSHNASIYLPDKALCISRVCEPKNRSAAMAPPGEASLVAEVPCSADDEVAALPEERLARRVINELAEVGLVQPQKVMEWRHHWLRHAYPVYSIDYQAQVDTLLEALQGVDNLHVTGRNGRFFYSHLHDQMRMAHQLVERLAGSRAAQGAPVGADFVPASS